MALGSKLIWFVRYLRVFSGLSDVLTYRRLRRDDPDCPARVGLRVRALEGRTLFCRPNTTDAWVLWRTFNEDDHLPPRPLPARCVILDLGANAGYTAAHYAHLYPEARIIAVEMDQENAELAVTNLAAFGPRCQVMHAAVWSNNGIIEYFREGKADSFTFARDLERPHLGQKLSVRSATIETLLAELGLDRVDYVKMDIEGAEASVLQPTASWLSQVDTMSVEVHSPATCEGCARILKDAGFQCSMPTHGMERVVAVRPASQP